MFIAGTYPAAPRNRAPSTVVRALQLGLDSTQEFCYVVDDCRDLIEDNPGLRELCSRRYGSCFDDDEDPEDIDQYDLLVYLADELATEAVGYPADL